MKHYMLTVYQPDGPAPPAEQLEAGTATVLRPRDGEVLTTDGPFTEGKEHLGGFTIIDVPDLDAALHWARRMAAIVTLPVEVRPFQEGGPQ